jgi:hypothetical protein
MTNSHTSVRIPQRSTDEVDRQLKRYTVPGPEAAGVSARTDDPVPTGPGVLGRG